MNLHADMSIQKQVEVLTENTAEVINAEELESKLRRSREENRSLKVKLGLDPSAPDIHLGHTVVLRKMRQFQDLGHEVICLIGDFTGRVGDPSGASATRRQLTEDEVRENAQTYAEQVFQILDPQRTTMQFNSSWLAPMTFSDLIELASNITVARMIERSDFAERLRSDRAVYVHEFFYPLMQGYDSVALEADVELGGTDQRFNLMVARDIQRAYGVEPEVAMLMPVLEGTDGVRKMSKSLDNYIGVTEDADSMFGKVMSISDDMIIRYFRHLTDVPADEVAEMEEQMRREEVNPRDLKVRLARTLVTFYHDGEAAARAEDGFAQVFARGGQPGHMDEVDVSRMLDEGGQVWVVHLVTGCDFATSNSEARRLVQQGAVSLDGEKITDPTEQLMPKDGAVLRVGKRRFARLRR